jgi:hypothetical protein
LVTIPPSPWLWVSVDGRTVTERWCQAVRELYELQQNSATDRRGNFAQNSIANSVTYGSFRDDIPNKFDKQQFLYPTNGSQHSSSPPTGRGSTAGGGVSGTSQSPAGGGIFDVLQTPQSHYIDEQKPSLLYPPTAEITSAAQKKEKEQRAVLEAMTQSASLPVSPYLGPSGFLNFVNNNPGDESFQFGTHVPYGSGAQNHMGDGLGMEEFPSLDEIISSMEGGGMDGGAMEEGFGFLDDLFI